MGAVDETRTRPAGDLVADDAGLPRAGETIAGKYRVERVLGTGGMGAVLSVTHLELGERFAIKFLRPSLVASDETVARFLREAQAAARIKSEHVVRVTDVARTDAGVPYIVMEQLDGEDLARVLAEKGPLPIADAVDYVLQACAGIAEAHALGIVHRDLKPSNLFLTRRSDGAPLVKVLDFGISKSSATDAGLAGAALTDSSAVFGSPAYMSPEQIRSAKSVDERTDVWSLGIILHELLTGRSPFAAETVGGLLSAIAADYPEPLRARRHDVPIAIEEAVLQCLAKNPGDRFASVADLAYALAPFKPSSGFVSVGRMRRVARVSEELPSPSVPTAPPLPPPPGFDAHAKTIADPRTQTGNQPSRAATLGAVLAFGALILLGILAMLGKLASPVGSAASEARGDLGGAPAAPVDAGASR